jgi:chromosome segregation ATPase
MLHERLFPIFLGLAVFAISIAFLYSYAKSIRQNQQKYTPSKPVQSAAPSQANIEEYENRIADLKLQIGQIENRISDLKMRLQAEEKTTSSRGVEDVEFRRYIGSIRAEIRENSDQLKTLNTQLKITEYMLNRANPARDDEQPGTQAK